MNMQVEANWAQQPAALHSGKRGVLAQKGPRLPPPAVPTLAQQPESSPVLWSLLPDYFAPDSNLSIAKNSDQTPLEFGRLVAPES